jgi:hypothetical protein
MPEVMSKMWEFLAEVRTTEVFFVGGQKVWFCIIYAARNNKTYVPPKPISQQYE